MGILRAAAEAVTKAGLFTAANISAEASITPAAVSALRLRAVILRVKAKPRIVSLLADKYYARHFPAIHSASKYLAALL